MVVEVLVIKEQVGLAVLVVAHLVITIQLLAVLAHLDREMLVAVE